MRAIVCIIVVILIIAALRPASAESPAQLPQKLVEQMEALPSKLKEIDQSIKMGQAVDKAQYEEMDVINAKIDKLEDLIAKPGPQKQPASLNQVVAQSKAVVKELVASGIYTQPDGYKSQWTYPGDIATHAATVHGISVAGKSKEQLEREHDAAHNATVTRSVVVQRPQVVRSNCPGGVCPTQPTRTRGWQPLLRRR
jgi:hypothetical protein